SWSAKAKSWSRWFFRRVHTGPRRCGQSGSRAWSSAADEVEESTAVGVRESGDGEDIVAQPAYQQGDVVGQSDGLGLGLRGQKGFPAQSLNLADLVAACLLLQFGFFPLQLLMGRDRIVGTIFQVGDDRGNVVQGMKDVAAARNVRQGQLLAGADARTE